MAADDFLRLPTLEALGSGIPRADESILVEHEDGVIANIFDKALINLRFGHGRVWILIHGWA